MKLMLVTSDIDNIREAEAAGVDRIFFDLEYINKSERQRGRDTLILHNDIEMLPQIRQVVKNAELLVRVNALYPHSKSEIDKAIEYGADIIMLPMVMDAEDVKILVELVGGRAKVMPMIETAQALARIDDIVAVKGIDEIYIGLNDLHISMGLTFMFELLANAEEVLDEKTKERIQFTDNMWKLSLNVNTSVTGSIMLSLYWTRPDKDEIYPFEEVKYFSSLR